MVGTRVGDEVCSHLELRQRSLPLGGGGAVWRAQKRKSPPESHLPGAPATPAQHLGHAATDLAVSGA